MLDDRPSMERVSKHHPCEICGGPDWCGYTADGRLAVCMRISDGSVKTTRNGGYLHILRDDPDWRKGPKVRTIRLDSPKRRHLDFGRLAAEYGAAVNMAKLQGLAEQLGVSVGSLVRLCVGWAGPYRAWSFPMCGPDERVRGIRLRTWGGRKLSVKGGREGLFLPSRLDLWGLLLIAEGPTDVAALLDLGFQAIGRPSCRGGVKLLVELVRRKRPADVVVVADRDENGAGQRGAESLAITLLPYCGSVRVVRPPDGIKDARGWMLAGGTHDDVMAAIEAAPIRKLRTRRRSSR